jgi:2,3-bisphosphoglycerate-dependent phosphoglycerate mutase
MTTRIIKHPSDCPKCAICQCRCCINKRTKCSRVKKALIQSDIQSNNHERRCLLILVRHGVSQDEVDKRYSGWNDCDLSNIGTEQMHRTGQALHQANFSIDLCFTSLLKRAIKSLFIIQEEMDFLWLPVYNTWRLNDRMLGSLTGFHRDRAEALFGQNQIKEWLTRSELAPPLLEESSALHPRLNYKYRPISSIVPSTETLIDIRKRVLPFFYDQLLNNLYLGQNILVVTHEDIVKAIIRLLNNYTVDEFGNQEIPIGVPIVFEFSLNTHELLNGYYLSSTLLESSANDQYQPFPTGFGSEKLNTTKDVKKPSLLSDIDPNLLKEEPDIHIKENFIGEVHLPTDLNSELCKRKGVYL